MSEQVIDSPPAPALASERLRAWWSEETYALKHGWSAASLLIALGLSLPLLFLIAHAIWPDAQSSAVIHKTVFWRYVSNTLLLSALVLAFSFAFAIPLAWWVSIYEFRGRKLLDVLLVLPLAFPTYIAAYAYSDLMVAVIPFLTWVRETFGVEAYTFAEVSQRKLLLSLIMAGVLYPYVYLAARSSFSLQCARLLEAARCLGHSPSSIFRRVALPLSRPAIVAGGVLVIMEVLNDYGAVSFFGVPTLTAGIFRSWGAQGDLTLAIRLALMLLSLVVFIFALDKLLRRKKTVAGGGGTEQPFVRSAPGRLSAIIWLAAVLPLGIGLFFPVWRLITWAAASKVVFKPSTGQALTNSLMMVALCTLGVLVLAMILVFSRRISKGSIARASSMIARMGYMMPGAVVAVGVMSGLGWLREVSGLVWMGTLGILVYAGAVRYMAVGLGALQSGTDRVCGKLEEASFSLGHSSWFTLRRVSLPMARFPLIAAGALTAIDLLKELPLTLILRPFNFETLATEAYGLATEGRVAEAAIPSLLIVFVGMIGVAILLHWQQKGARIA